VAKDKKKNGLGEYATMQIADLRISRRGKHHQLVSGILQQLENLANGSALIVPLDSVGEMSLPGLRSAVTRITRAHRMPIKTNSDQKNFYIWRKPQADPKKKKTLNSPD
jgi:hypothetical protein